MAQENKADLQAHFETLRQAWWPAIRSLMNEAILATSSEGSLLSRMANYHLQTGGKRLRAILPLLIAEALGKDPRQLLPFGAACEMLHNASLVHDDLQDGDTTRRNQATVWKKFGNAQAINLGDAMIAHTILLLQRLEVPSALRERVTTRVLLEMLRVIEGQTQELDLKNRPAVTLADYMEMIEGKTSRLFALPMGGAALLCEAPEEVEEGLIEAARHIGVLFQIQDDILDIYGEKGREHSGNDICEGKQSVLVVHCLGVAGTQESKRLKSILDKPRNETGPDDIVAVRELFAQSGSLGFALDQLEQRRKAALNLPAFASYPRLTRVLSEACEIFLYPIRSLTGAGLGSSPH